MNSMAHGVPHFGATREDWLALSFMADLTADLLPTVSNPNAEISELSKLRQLGKVPSMYNGHRKATGIANWTEKRSTERDIDRWSADPDLGICIQARRVRALDVDITDPALADRVMRAIEPVLGHCPLRTRPNSSKFLVAFRLPEGIQYGYRWLQVKSGERIEFLADGKQFVAVGTHPSGERYTWRDGTPDEFPTIDAATFEALWLALKAEFACDEYLESGNVNAPRIERRSIDTNDPVVEFLEGEGFVKSMNRDGRINIRCPFEDQHSGPSADDTATQYMPRGVGGFEQGHFKCLHAHCSKRNDGDFLNAIGYGVDEFPVVEVSAEQEAAEAIIPPFKRTESSGKIMPTISNLMLALRAPQWLGLDIALDTFRDELMITPTGRRQWRSFTDPDYTRVRLTLASAGLEIGLEVVKEGIGLRGDENRFDSAILWLKEEIPAWDGVPRIDRFYPAYFGTDDSPYTQAVGAYTWTALAARVLDPGHKVDMVPILCSGEGCRKSESIAAMVPDRDFFAEIDLGLKDDDLSRLMRGRLIAELGEMRGLRKREMGHLKAFITRRFENWVPKYREFAVKFPRRLLFIGTTNETEFLSDQTGRRRWLPMNITRADTEAIERDQAQLWAEGRERFLRSGVAFYEAEELAKDEHGKFEESHPWEDVIEKWLGMEADLERGVINGDRPFSIDELLVGALNLPVHRLSKHERNEAAGCLRRLGYESGQVRDGGRRKWIWRRCVTQLV